MSPDPNLPSAAELLQHSSWMRALARRLCVDEASAEDLAQDVWLRVLSDARAAPAKPRAWLARVLTNLAREKGRGESARRRREHAVSRGIESRAADDLIERVEISRRLVDHVLALEEPYRSTVLGRYFDERSCEELAHEAGVPASTVRTRLERGLARLRERLRRDTGHAWLGAALPALAHDGTALAHDGTALAHDGSALARDGTSLARDGTALAHDGTALAGGGNTLANDGAASGLERLSRAHDSGSLLHPATSIAPGAGSSTSLGASTGSWIGVLGMSGLKVAAVVACGSLGAWWIWRQLEPSEAVVPPLVTRALDEPMHDEPVHDAPVSQPPVAQERSTSTPTPPRVASASSPVAGARPGEPSAAEIEALERETPPGVIEGIVLVGREPLTTGGRIVHHPGYFARLPERPELVGPDSDVRSVPIDAQGVFRIAGLESGDHTLAVDLGQGAQHETTVKVSADASRRVVIVLGSARVFGCVRDENGVPVAGARVCVSLSTRRRGSSGSFGTTRATGTDGRYDVRDLPAGSYWFTVLRSGEWESHSQFDTMQKLTLEIGEERELDFGGADGAARVQGRILGSDGVPLRGSGRVHLVAREGRAYSEIGIDGSGAFDARVLPGEYEVSVSFGGCEDVERWPVGAWVVTHQDSTRDLTIASARFVGVAVAAATGIPWTSSGVRVYARPVKGGTPNCHVEIGADGRFAIHGVRPGVYRIQTHPFELAQGALEITVGERDVEVPLRLVLKGP